MTVADEIRKIRKFMDYLVSKEIAISWDLHCEAMSHDNITYFGSTEDYAVFKKQWMKRVFD